MLVNPLLNPLCMYIVPVPASVAGWSPCPPGRPQADPWPSQRQSRRNKRLIKRFHNKSLQSTFIVREKRTQVKK